MTVVESHREHGTYVKYVQDRCRCEACRDANRTYERNRAARIAPPYVAAQPARDHIAFLAEHGVGLKTIAKVSGVAHGALWKIVYGMPSTGRPPSKRIRPDTMAKILAVTPADAADGSRIDAAVTWAHIDRLVAAGLPKVEIARRIGQTGPGLQLSRNQVSPRNARAVAAIAAELDAGTLVYVRRSRHGNVETHATAPEPVTEEAPVYDDQDQLTLRLVELLEDRIDQASWRAQAACRGRDPWLWFPARGDHETLAAARKICSACFVRDECLEANLSARDGVYGGKSSKERSAIRRSRVLEAAA